MVKATASNFPRNHISAFNKYYNIQKSKSAYKTENMKKKYLNYLEKFILFAKLNFFWERGEERASVKGGQKERESIKEY